MRAYVNIVSDNIYNSKDYTYHDVRDIKVLKGDKDFSIRIMDSKKYYEKNEAMVNEYIKKGFYKEITSTILHDLKLFQDFLYCNFKNYKETRLNRTKQELIHIMLHK